MFGTYLCGGGLPLNPPIVHDTRCTTQTKYGDFQDALLSTFLVSFGFEDARAALDTLWPTVSIILLCIFNFLVIIIMLNMLITLMGALLSIDK